MAGRHWRVRDAEAVAGLQRFRSRVLAAFPQSRWLRHRQVCGAEAVAGIGRSGGRAFTHGRASVVLPLLFRGCATAASTAGFRRRICGSVAAALLRCARYAFASRVPVAFFAVAFL